MQRDSKVTLTEIVNEIIQIKTTGNDELLSERLSAFEDLLESSGRSEQKNAIELITTNRETLGAETADKMRDELKNLLDLYGELS